MSASLSCTLVIIKLDSLRLKVFQWVSAWSSEFMSWASLCFLFSVCTSSSIWWSFPNSHRLGWWSWCKYKRHSNYSSVLGHNWSSLGSNYKSITVDCGIKCPLSWWKKLNSQSPGHSPDSFHKPLVHLRNTLILHATTQHPPNHFVISSVFQTYLYLRDRKLLLFDQAHLLLPLLSEDVLLNITVRTLWWM